METKEVKINKKLYDLLVKLKEDRKIGSVACTADPIYLVQSRYKEYDHEECIPDFVEIYFQDNDYVDEEKPCYTLEEIKNGELRSTNLPCSAVMQMEEAQDLYQCIDILRDYVIEAEIIQGIYTYKTKAYFLSYQEAKEYMEYQKHNLTFPRIYEDYIGYRNYGSLAKLINLLDEGDLFEDN